VTAKPPAGSGDRAQQEFLSEAQELVDGLGRDLLVLDSQVKKGGGDPDLLNNVFRAVHTLKGLSGLFGVSRIANLSHNLENLLDDLRLGRVDLSSKILDLLFESAELYGKLLGEAKEGREEGGSEVEDLILSLDRAASRQREPEPHGLAGYDLDPTLLGVLTEYEEHRLRTNVDRGIGLFKIRARMDLMTIDASLEALKSRAKPLGEIITYLPSSEGTTEDGIELDILLASSRPFEEVHAALAGPGYKIEQVQRRKAAAEPAAPRTSSATMAGAEEKEPGGAMVPASLRSVAQTVRVDIRKLDRLMNLVGELNLVRNLLAQLGDDIRLRTEVRELRGELHRIHRSFDRHLADLQEGILEARMVPLGQAFDKLARIVRQISKDEGKEIQFVVSGAETEVDKLIVEDLSDPLMHIVRNAIDHGVESPALRTTSGKPTAGTIAVNAFQRGNHVVIEIEDDGSGIDVQRLVEAAVASGALEPDEAPALGERELLHLVFLPGVSTKESADELSGRGVGMDVVRTNIARLGGVVDVQSEIGIGTKFTVTLPITLAIIQALVVEVSGRTYAMPLSTVQEVLSLRDEDVATIEGHEVLTLRGQTLPLCRLEELLRLSREAPPPARPRVVVARVAARRLGLVVDAIIGQQDIVIKALGRSLRQVRGFSGAADVGGDRLALVIDPGSIIEEVLAPARGELREGSAA